MLMTIAQKVMKIVTTAKIQLFARSNYIGGDGVERMREKNARRGDLRNGRVELKAHSVDKNVRDIRRYSLWPQSIVRRTVTHSLAAEYSAMLLAIRDIHKKMPDVIQSH